MKKIIILLLIFIAGCFNVQSVLAQVTDLYLVVVPYQTREDLDILFFNSTRTLQYLDGEDIPKPTFMALLTKDQEQILTSQGYEVKIIDTNTDLSRYILLSNHQKDQSSLLRSLGEVTVISPYLTLLKIPAGQTFIHEGDAIMFDIVPWPEKSIPTPLYRTKTITGTDQPEPTATATTPTPIKTAENPLISFLPILAIVGFVIIVLIILVLKKKRGGNIPPQPPQPQQSTQPPTSSS